MNKNGLRLPTWPGASQVYSYLYTVLEKMGASNWAAEIRQAKNNGVSLGRHGLATMQKTSSKP